MSHVDVESSRSNWVINLIVILIKKRLIILLQYIAVWITYMIFFLYSTNADATNCHVKVILEGMIACAILIIGLQWVSLIWTWIRKYHLMNQQ